MAVDYAPVTELPGVRADREQIQRIYHRYRIASDRAEGRDVLEVGCGGGQGLGYLAKRARRVVGGDRILPTVRTVARHYRGRVPLLQLDAHELPFRGQSFDMVLLFEVLYYLSNPDKFFAECHRVLRPSGMLLISTVNSQWADFNPSPFSHHYFTSAELRDSMARHGFDVQLYAGFPVGGRSPRNQLVSVVRRVAVRLGLIPKSFRYKALLKRLVYGRLGELPPEITDQLAPFEPPIEVGQHTAAEGYKILYAIARLG